LHMSKVLSQRLWGPTVCLLCVWTFAASSAQTVQMKRERIARVERVRLLRGGGLILEIEANAPISPRTHELGGPDRLVIDVPDATPGTGLHNLAVHSGEIRDIRVGLFSANPPITRIVVDWKSRQPYQVLQSGRTVIVKLTDDAPVQVDRPRTASASRRFSSRVERVSLLAGSEVQLEIAANGPIAPQTQVVSVPDRLVIDVPDAIPGIGLHNLTVHRGEVRAVRAGLFSANPPVTRIVVDLNRPQPYQLFPSGNTVVVKLGPEVAAAQALVREPKRSLVPKVIVSYHGGLLSIHADRATLAEVLNEVHRETGADIELPPRGGQDEIVVDLGPARASDVLTSLLNGTGFNFILIGSGDDPSRLQSVLFAPKESGVLATDLSGAAAQEQPQSSISSSSRVIAGSFRNKNKDGSPSSAPAPVTTPALAPLAPASPGPSSQASDEELSTPPPATPPDQSQPPPRL
jgi:AMIN domain